MFYFDFKSIKSSLLKNKNRTIRNEVEFPALRKLARKPGMTLKEQYQQLYQTFDKLSADSLAKLPAKLSAAGRGGVNGDLVKENTDVSQSSSDAVLHQNGDSNNSKLNHKDEEISVGGGGGGGVVVLDWELCVNVQTRNINSKKKLFFKLQIIIMSFYLYILIHIFFVLFFILIIAQCQSLKDSYVANFYFSFFILLYICSLSAFLSKCKFIFVSLFDFDKIIL